MSCDEEEEGGKYLRDMGEKEGDVTMEMFFAIMF